MAGFYAMFTVFWNLMPLPNSVFWEVIPLSYRGLTGKQFPFKTIKGMQTTAYVILGLMIAWIFVNDLSKLF
jgi:hypothetical protein